VGQNKQYKFSQIEKFENVFQFDKTKKGQWAKAHFRNNHPITLELACGKGEYSTGLGREFPNRNYIGIDIKGNRIYTGAKKALEEGLQNVAFLRTRINQITEYFDEGEVDEIWIIFPDPFLRDSKAKNRLTHQNFLSLYQKILKPGGTIHLKTDSPPLYQFTLETIESVGATVVSNWSDIYGKGLNTGALSIQTFYEKMHLEDGRQINYVSFTLPVTEIKPAPKKAKVTDEVAE